MLLGAQCMLQAIAYFLIMKKAERTRAQHLYMWSQAYWVFIIIKDYWFFSSEVMPYQWAILLDLSAVPISSFFVLEQYFPTKVTNQFCLKRLYPFFAFLLISIIGSIFSPYRKHNVISDFWEFVFLDFQNILVFLAGIYTISYALFCLYLIISQKRKYRKYISENYSYTENINLEWINGVIYALLGLLFFYVAIYFSNLNSRYSDIFYYICSLSIWIYVYLNVAKQEPLTINPRYWEEEGNLDEKTFLDDDCDPTVLTNETTAHKYKYKSIEQKIYFAFEDEKLHLNSRLTIVDLAVVCDINRTYLSDFFNKGLGCSFYDFVNRYRIEHVSIPMLEKESDFYSLEEIAFASGFGSVSTFKRAFQKITNIPPSSYFEKYTIDNN